MTKVHQAKLVKEDSILLSKSKRPTRQAQLLCAAAAFANVRILKLSVENAA
jgi:hypothetical protein